QMPGLQGACLSRRQGLRRNSQRTGLEPRSGIVHAGEGRLGLWMLQMKTNTGRRTGGMGARQIYEALRDQIMALVYGTDGQLPSSRALAGELGVARSTVTVAYEQLAAEGFIETRHGARPRV